MTTFFENANAPTKVLEEARALAASLAPLRGNGPPVVDTGIVGQVYYDLTDPLSLILYGPKSEAGWGDGLPLRGLRGFTGPANSTFLTKADLIAQALPSNGSAILTSVPDGGTFAWTTGDFTAQVALDPYAAIYVVSSKAPKTQGCWVRQYTGPAQAVWAGVSETATGDRNAIAIDNLIKLAREVQLPKGTFRWNGVPIGTPGATLRGAGKTLTKMVATNTAHIYPNSGTGYRISDMTFHTDGTGALAGQIGSYHQDVADMRIERCAFTNSGQLGTNAFQAVTDNAPVGWTDFYLVDCDIQGARMCVELQNHGTSVAKFKRVVIDRCRFYDAGKNYPSGSDASMCISISGLSEGVRITNCTIGFCSYVGIELVHSQGAFVDSNAFEDMPLAAPLSVTDGHAPGTFQVGHTITNNKMPPTAKGNFLRLFNMDGGIFANNTFYLNNSVQLRSKNVKVIGNTLESVTNNCLVVDNGTAHGIRGNTLSSQNGPTLLFINSSTENTSADNNLIVRNAAQDPTVPGFFVTDATTAKNNLIVRSTAYVPTKKPVAF